MECWHIFILAAVVVGASIAFKRIHRWFSHTGKADLEIEKARLATEQEKFRAALEKNKTFIRC